MGRVHPTLFMLKLNTKNWAEFNFKHNRGMMGKAHPTW